MPKISTNLVGHPIIIDLQSVLTNLKPLKYFLVLEVVRPSKRISLCHHQYALEVLLGTEMLGCKPLDSLWIKSWSSLIKLDGELLKDTSSYRRLSGWLLYLTLTKLDITYVVHKLSHFLDKPRAPHLHATFHILQ